MIKPSQWSIQLLFSFFCCSSNLEIYFKIYCKINKNDRQIINIVIMYYHIFHLASLLEVGGGHFSKRNPSCSIFNTLNYNYLRVIWIQVFAKNKHTHTHITYFCGNISSKLLPPHFNLVYAQLLHWKQPVFESTKCKFSLKSWFNPFTLQLLNANNCSM